MNNDRFRAIAKKEKEEKGNYRDLAYLLGVHERTIQRWVKHGIPEKSRYDEEKLSSVVQKGVPKKKEYASAQTKQLRKQRETLTTKELASEYNVHVRTIQRWLKDGVPAKRTKYVHKPKKTVVKRHPIIHGVAHFKMKKFGADWYEGTPLRIDTQKNRIELADRLDKLVSLEMNKGLYEGDIELISKGIEPVNVQLKADTYSKILARG